MRVGLGSMVSMGLGLGSIMILNDNVYSIFSLVHWQYPGIPYYSLFCWLLYIVWVYYSTSRIFT